MSWVASVIALIPVIMIDLDCSWALSGSANRWPPRRDMRQTGTALGSQVFRSRVDRGASWPGLSRPSTTKSCCRSDPIRIRHGEIVPVRHLHLWQGLGVHHVGLADQLVDAEQVGGERVDLVVVER